MVCTTCSDACRHGVPPFCHSRRRMVYLGPSRLALSYFETIGFAVPPNENPAGERAPFLPSGPQMLVAQWYCVFMVRAPPRALQLASASFSSQYVALMLLPQTLQWT